QGILSNSPQWSPEPLEEDFEAIAAFVEILEELKIPYHIGGSIASSMHGEPRSTADGDIVVSFERLWQIPQLLEKTDAQYFTQATRQEMQDAVRLGKSDQIFQFYYRKTSFKLDIHIAGATSFDEMELQRSVPMEIAGKKVMVKSPEDIVIRKLMWAKMHTSSRSEVSEKQLRDAGRVLEVSGDDLDKTYLWKWAQKQGVADLLEEFLGPPPS
ncbi:MAG: nucleotidyltransferase family protein, partial [Candidatus Xenobia bacterium]